MKIYERIFLLILFGSILPLTLFLAGWVGSLNIVRENRIFLFALFGLLVGILTDFLFIGKLIDQAYKLKTVWLILIYLFYSGLIFGFFMNLPAFNILMAIVGGAFVGRKLHIQKTENLEIKKYTRFFALFSAGILFLICFISIILVLKNKITASHIIGMFGHVIHLTKLNLLIIVVTGGVLLLFANYLIALGTVKKTIEWSMKMKELQDIAMNKNISIIVAIAENRAIGKDNKLLWHISEDLKRFKKITAGHVVLMGKKTYESLSVKPLPKRKNIVISDMPGEQIEGCIMAYSIKDALSKLDEEKENFIIGGASIYKQFFSMANKLYITRVHATFDADTFFPEISEKQWEIIETEQPKEKHPNGLRYSFVTYSRKK
jgi:dihydrofolate reductase